ncbi:hypothetical protein FZEAL_10792 [Fusarium zealandicum]|uniref:Pali-domain-containing protein n=1 Tax=Fusarium zealandicum TaxID=1053134 RepID=A0A8H4TWC0_9HYPO|nr:hypothetical protein FZEAL_10792 [Fusarium zealandicum]
MGVGRFIHHIGAFLLLAATVLLIVVDITAPVVNNIALFKIDAGSSGVSFGTFGYCITRDNADDNCSKAQIGYNPAQVIQTAAGNNDVDFSGAGENAVKALTHVMVLHPIATGLCFIAFLLALFAGPFGSLLSSLASLLAFLVTVVALACDFAGFSIVRHRVNRDSNSLNAQWSVAIWLVLAAAILALLGTILVFLTCCSGRRRRRRESSKMSAYQASPAARY